ncbi:MAG: alcohol dehydrogenase catalytic domain-containing protein [Proteobacteria bacterium]|nr:alcohol dehydrogenase catalytic domain-containing protein [Pseudomonadota bacterium]
MPETSVIIRTFNEAKHLPKLLEALKAQTYRDFETIVVDSGSYDATRDIARRHADKLIEIPQHDFTFGHSLNAGIKNSGGRFLAIISAHAAPTDPSWLGSLVEPLRSEQTAMVYGRQIGDEQTKLGEFVDFLRVFGTEKKILTAPNFFANNANSAARRDLWERHPFDESLPGLEDIEWAKFFMEAGYQVVYEPKSCVFHIHEESWAQVRRRYYREGQAAKWIGVVGRRDIPGVIFREVRSFFGDLRWASGQKKIGSPLDIFRFRYEKLRGIFSGIVDGAAMENPIARRRLFFDRPYKAVVIRGPGEAAIEDIAMPALRPGEVLIRVAYQGVCATDLEILDGSLGYYRDGLADYPIIPGHEFSGVVAACGARVNDLPEGSRVVVECIQGCGYCEPCRAGRSIGCEKRQEVGVVGRDGGYAEFMITPRKFVHKLPDSLDLRRASLCEPTAVVLKGLRRLSSAWKIPHGVHRCAVIGAGAIGHLTALILNLRGQDVTIFDQDPRRLKWFEGSSITTSSELRDLARFQILIEATGNPGPLEAILRDSAAGAIILLLGFPYACREFNFESIVGYDKTIVGSVGSSAEDFQEAISVLSKIDLRGFEQALFTLADYQLAWQAARQRQALKVTIQLSADEAEWVR